MRQKASLSESFGLRKVCGVVTGLWGSMLGLVGMMEANGLVGDEMGI